MLDRLGRLERQVNTALMNRSLPVHPQHPFQLPPTVTVVKDVDAPLDAMAKGNLDDGLLIIYFMFETLSSIV